MIAAIMQPYFFPYIGYFQLMHCVDTFVFLDDVQYINRGWVNRNRMLAGDKTSWLTKAVVHAPRSERINQRQYVAGQGPEMIAKILGQYGRYPMHEEVPRLLGLPETNVASYNEATLQKIANILGVDCEFLVSSKIEKDDALRGQDRIIEICKRIGADRYINPIGGVGLYNSSRFSDAGIELKFLTTTAPASVTSDGMAHLSILHQLLTLGADRTAGMLGQYELRLE